MIASHTVRSTRRWGRSLFLPVVGSLVLTGMLTAAAQPSAHQSVTSIPGFLYRVSAVSASDAWAVGTVGNPSQPLIVHWDGTRWSKVTSPNVSTAELSGVSMVSAADGWAVGTNFSGPIALIEHWDGTGWTQVPPPPISGFGSSLRGVSMVSATDGFAVGYYVNGNEVPRPLVLHWDGIRWSQVPVSVPAGYTVLLTVSAASAADAWEVGNTQLGGGLAVLTLHWDGTRWSQVPIPNPGLTSAGGVSDASPGNAWAVGAQGSKTLSLHWNGTAWQRVFSPSPGHQTCSPCNTPPNQLGGVAIVSRSNAWSVGGYTTSTGGTAALTLHWNGTRWARVPNQGGTSDSYLAGITMASATDGWAVGGRNSATGNNVLILRWNGTTWSRS